MKPEPKIVSTIRCAYSVQKKKINHVLLQMCVVESLFIGVIKTVVYSNKYRENGFRLKHRKMYISFL